MSTLKERQQLISNAAERMGKETFKGTADKVATPRSEYQKESTKVVSLEDAIRKSGLKDGMTISFHHHFRSGDKVINMVVAKLAEMGYKNLHLASSSLIDVHEPLIEHIRNGVITRISTSGLRGKLAAEVSHGLMDEPVVFRSHGSRGAAIANGDLHIDVAFIGASSADPLGNACGYSRSENAKSICGSLGYALPDAQYADKVVILTDDLVKYPNTPNSISERNVDFVVEVDSVGDSSKIASGAIRDTKNPRDILLAQQAAKVIINSGYFKEGFSIQTGSGGASLAAVKFIREEMIKQGIHASFALGGITAHMVKMHEEGLIETHRRAVVRQGGCRIDEERPHASGSVVVRICKCRRTRLCHSLSRHGHTLCPRGRRQLQCQRARRQRRHHQGSHWRTSRHGCRLGSVDNSMSIAARTHSVYCRRGNDVDNTALLSTWWLLNMALQ